MTRVLVAAFTSVLLATAAGAATPQRGGVVVDGLGFAYTCLNSFACDTGDALGQVLEGAYEPATDGTPRPHLVSGVSIGKDRVTLTYHIRPKARWNDGVTVSAADFAFTRQANATHGKPDARKLYGRIRRFRTVDPKTFVIELKEPFAEWQGLFFEVLPRHALLGEDLTAVWRDRVDNPKTRRPIGNGPFLVSRLESGQLTLIRNPAYWGRHTAYLARFVFRFDAIDAADPLGPLRRNEIDFAGLGGLLFGRAAEVRRLPGWRVESWPGVAYENLVFRIGPGGHLALKNKLVRRALAYGIDRVQIARRINADLGRSARPLDSTAFVAGDPAFRPNWNLYRYDPARARRLLEQAGCRREPGAVYYSCGGERLQLRFATTSGSVRRGQTLQLIETQLKEAGVEVQPRYFPPQTFFGAVLPSGDFDVALFQWNVLPGGVAVPVAKCGDPLNSGGYCSRLTMRDVQQVDRIVDPSKRARLLNAIDVKLARDVPLLPLFQPVLQIALKKTIKGFVAGGSPGVPIEHNEDWWLER